MNRMDPFHALHFHDDQVLDDQIDPIPQFDLLSVEYNWQPDLTGHAEAAFSEFMGKTALISAFEQPRSEDRMNVHCGRHDRARNLIYSKLSKRRNRSRHPNYIAQKVRFTL